MSEHCQRTVKRRQKPGDESDQGGFARSIGTQNGEKLSLRNGEIEILENGTV